MITKHKCLIIRNGLYSGVILRSPIVYMEEFSVTYMYNVGHVYMGLQWLKGVSDNIVPLFFFFFFFIE